MMSATLVLQKMRKAAEEVVVATEVAAVVMAAVVKDDLCLKCSKTCVNVY